MSSHIGNASINNVIAATEFFSTISKQGRVLAKSSVYRPAKEPRDVVCQGQDSAKYEEIHQRVMGRQ